MSIGKNEFIPLRNSRSHKNYVLIDKKQMNRFFMTLDSIVDSKKFAFKFKDDGGDLVISRLSNGVIGFLKKSKELEISMMLNLEKETNMFVKDLNYGLEQRVRLVTTKVVDELPERLVFSYKMLGDKNEVIDEFSMEVREEN